MSRETTDCYAEQAQAVRGKWEAKHGRLPTRDAMDLDELVAAALRAAVAEERESITKFVAQAGNDYTPPMWASRDIAARIRARGEGE